ncbi:type III secretion system cytoplasmic ring protein SctQ [Pseudoduganella violaceinigra]|uniref:type III secretion system cytoplasmic ring protein SctQ n=1 Tax=Pseudoduganella violaceinigra TaxID=246602 RepID=UPI00042688AB|nr:type III secretion system cytoplasmic ring protein SctQ [Pseudoduganella violaceinigra]
MDLRKGTVSAAGAALSRRVARGVCGSHAGMILHLEPADEGLRSSGCTALRGPHGLFYLDDGAALLHGLTGIDPRAAAPAPAAQREWMDAALLGRLGATPLGAMRSLQRDAAPPDDAGMAVMHVRLDDGTHMTATLACASAEAWLALLEHPAWRTKTLPLAAMDALRIPLPVHLGSHRLPASALQGIGVDDIILPACTRFDTRGEGRIPLGGLLAQVRYTGPGLLTILTLETQLNYDSKDETGGQQYAGEDDAALDQLPLALCFELGTLQLNLGQLRTLASGAVLQLAQGSSDSIAIVCGGRHLGRGEAVDVDGRLGVRITSWSAA